MTKATYITGGIASEYETVALDVMTKAVSSDELMERVHKSIEFNKCNAHVFLDGYKHGMVKAIELIMTGKLNIRIVKKD